MDEQLEKLYYWFQRQVCKILEHSWSGPIVKFDGVSNFEFCYRCKEER
jgi:hypothetical protein